MLHVLCVGDGNSRVEAVSGGRASLTTVVESRDPTQAARRARGAGAARAESTRGLKHPGSLDRSGTSDADELVVLVGEFGGDLREFNEPGLAGAAGLGVHDQG